MSGLFGGGSPTPVAPPKPTPMVDETAVAKAKARTAARVRQSGGRESTILGASEKLGS